MQNKLDLFFTFQLTRVCLLQNSGQNLGRMRFMKRVVGFTWHWKCWEQHNQPEGHRHTPQQQHDRYCYVQEEQVHWIFFERSLSHDVANFKKIVSWCAWTLYSDKISREICLLGSYFSSELHGKERYSHMNHRIGTGNNGPLIFRLFIQDWVGLSNQIRQIGLD